MKGHMSGYLAWISETLKRLSLLYANWNEFILCWADGGQPGQPVPLLVCT